MLITCLVFALTFSICKGGTQHFQRSVTKRSAHWLYCESMQCYAKVHCGENWQKIPDKILCTEISDKTCLEFLDNLKFRAFKYEACNLPIPKLLYYYTAVAFQHSTPGPICIKPAIYPSSSKLAIYQCYNAVNDLALQIIKWKQMQLLNPLPFVQATAFDTEEK